MGKRKDVDSTIDSAKKQRVQGELLIHCKTKTSLISILQTLDANGLLTEGFYTESNCKKELARVGNALATVLTPYGPIIQYMSLEGQAPWPYVHPFAWLYHLSHTVPAYA